MQKPGRHDLHGIGRTRQRWMGGLCTPWVLVLVLCVQSVSAVEGNDIRNLARGELGGSKNSKETSGGSSSVDSVESTTTVHDAEGATVKRLWGVADTTATVGKFFQYHIPSDAFSGPVSRFEVSAAGGSDLPSWLHFKAGTAILEGVPTESDLGQHYITVKAIRETVSSGEHDHAKDVFSIDVMSANHKNSAALPLKTLLSSDEVVRCEAGEGVTKMALAVDTDVQAMPTTDRITLLENLATYLQVDKTAQTILDKSHYSKGPIIQEARLRERKFGEVEGKTFSELKRLARRANQLVPSFTPSGAETVQQVRHRAVLFFQELCQLLLKTTENGKKDLEHTKELVNGVGITSESIDIVNGSQAMTVGGIKRRRQSSLVYNGDDSDCVLKAGDSSANAVIKRERSELSSSDDETMQNISGLLKTAGKHLESLSPQTNKIGTINGHGPASSGQLCVYVPSRSSRQHRVRSGDGNHREDKPKNRIQNGSHEPQGMPHPAKFHNSLSLSTGCANFTSHTSTTAFHDTMNGDCPNVSLSPLGDHRLSWRPVAELHRKASIDSSNDECDASPGLGANVLVVSHGGLLRELVRHFVEDLGCTIPGGKGQALRISPNTGMSKFTVSLVDSDDKPKVICLLIHDKDHLTENGFDVTESSVL